LSLQVGTLIGVADARTNPSDVLWNMV
jgi:hypothetical protein